MEHVTATAAGPSFADPADDVVDQVLDGIGGTRVAVALSGAPDTRSHGAVLRENRP